MGLEAWMNIFQKMEYTCITCLMMYKIYNKSVPEYYIYKEFSIKKQCTN